MASHANAGSSRTASNPACILSVATVRFTLSALPNGQHGDAAAVSVSGRFSAKRESA
jgi:hypothetical protein